jgi:hypothetical protein
MNMVRARKPLKNAEKPTSEPRGRLLIELMRTSPSHDISIEPAAVRAPVRVAQLEDLEDSEPQ